MGFWRALLPTLLLAVLVSAYEPPLVVERGRTYRLTAVG